MFVRPMCVCQGINSILPQTARFNSYILPLLQTISSEFSPAGGAALTGSGSPYVQGAANTPQLLAMQLRHLATRHTLQAHVPPVCVCAKGSFPSCSNCEVQHSYCPTMLQKHQSDVHVGPAEAPSTGLPGPVPAF